MSVAQPVVRSWWLSPYGLLLLAGIATGVLAWYLIALPVVTLSNVDKHPQHFGIVFAHMVGGTLMLFLGAANLYVGATRRFFKHHKTLGYLYLAGGSVAAVMAIVMALASPHRANNQGFAVDMSATDDMGFALATLGAAWIVCAAMGYRAVKNRRYDSHQAWMIRSYVLTWSFVLCRLVAHVPVLANLGNGVAIIWLSWIVPLLVCEVALQWPAGKSLRAG